MGFFKNRDFNFIYIHGALQSFANYGGEAFAFIYLLKAGFAVPVVLVAIGVLFGSRVLFRQFVLPVALKIGLRNALIFGVILEGLAYPLLSQVTEVGPIFFVYLITFAISSSFYWTTYHSYVALIGDSEHRGKQVSGLEFIGTIVGIIAPIVTGLLLTYFAPVVAFSVVGMAMMCAAIPLLFAPNVEIENNLVVPPDMKWLARGIMFSDGLRAGTFHFTWLIALFITLGSNFASFGGVLALAGIIGAAVGLYTGKHVDLGNGKTALKYGFAAIAVAILGRAFGYAEVWSAVLANALAVAIWPIYSTATNSRVYELAKRSPCPLRFLVIAEGGWDVGTALSCFSAAFLLYLGFGFTVPLLLALVGCALGYWIFSSSSASLEKV